MHSRKRRKLWLLPFLVAAFGVLMAQSAIAAPNPSIVDPSSVQNDGPKTLTISGTGFESGATVRLTKTGQAEIPGTNVSVTPLSIRATFDITIAAPGDWNVVVTNPDMTTGTCADCLLVTSPAPMVDSVAPTATSNTAPVTLTITGSGFATGASTRLERTGQTDIVGTSVTVDNATTMHATFAITDAAPGAWDVRVTNTDEATGLCVGCFTVNLATPTVVSANPSSLAQGASDRDVSISGTEFLNGATVGFSGAGITVNSTTFVSSTVLTVNIDVANDAPLGLRDLTVTNPNGSPPATCIGCFAVAGVPTVTSLTPAYSAPGESSRTIIISGTSFNAGATVSFGPPGITVNSTTRNSSFTITVNISVASNATTGRHSVTVTNTNGGSGTCVDCFRVIHFADVPPGSFGFDAIETIADAGVTGGCALDPTRYCPSSQITRGQMAVFLLRAMGHGDPAHLPAYRGLFADVPASNSFARFIEHLYDHGVTGGCDTSPRRFCPNDPVTRGQMAVFLLRANGHAGHLPAYRGLFADVPASNSFARYIEHLYDHAITGGCGTNPLRYCPGSAVTRAQMAIFMVKAFEL